MAGESKKLSVGKKVILLGLSPEVLEGLPEEDRRAVTAMVGKQVMLVGYDDAGRVEVHFTDPFEPQSDESSHTHSIWVTPEFVGRHRK